MNHHNTTTPSVSVVIPFYKGVEWLCEAVDSVLAQDYAPMEIIVVNDGSDEDVSGFLERYGDKIKYIKKENGGCSSARNAGNRVAECEYIAFMDSDDLWTPDKLSRQMGKMLQYSAVWSFTDFETFGEAVPTTLKKMYADGSEGFYSHVSPYIGTPTVICRRDVIDDNELSFCEEFRYGQDNVFWECLLAVSPVLYIPENLARVRIRGNNAAKRAAVQIHARVDIYDNCARLIDGYREKQSLLYRFAIALCRFGRFFVRRDSKNGFNEFVARVLFALPYVLFKIDRRKTKGKQA